MRYRNKVQLLIVNEGGKIATQLFKEWKFNEEKQLI